MLHQPIYDPQKTYEENFERGPFGAFADAEVFANRGEMREQFFGRPVYLPFGVAAGPLLNAKYVKAALSKGFDLAVYKTVRTRIYPVHPWPNVLPVTAREKFTPHEEQTLVARETFSGQLSVTNSFGVPSFNPDFWQKDMAQAAAAAGPGQLVIGSFQGTAGGKGGAKEYVADFALAARLVKETKAPILEVNLSCPNEGKDELLCFDLPRVREVVEAIKNEIGNTPLMIKMAYFHDQQALRKLVESVGAMIEGIAAINTIPAKIVDEQGRQALPGEGRQKSGVGGAAIKWAGLEMTKRLGALREELGLRYRIVGIGGVVSPADYLEYREAGADAVMSATGMMWNPYLAVEIKQQLKI